MEKRQRVDKCTRLRLQEVKDRGKGSVTDLMALDEWGTTMLNNAGYSHLNLLFNWFSKCTGDNNRLFNTKTAGYCFACFSSSAQALHLSLFSIS